MPFDVFIAGMSICDIVTEGNGAAVVEVGRRDLHMARLRRQDIVSRVR